MRERDEPAGRWRGVALWVLMGAFLVAMLGVIAALALSVKVHGSSMEPALAPDDRLLVVPGAEVERFDIVESALGDQGLPVVKRVIGMPGDRITVTGGEGTQVLVIPAGEETSYVVDNPAWPDRIGSSVEPCCAGDGTSLAAGEPAAEVVVPEGHYWLVGDNWGASDDSRTFGFANDAGVRGRAAFRVQPLGTFGGLEHDVRLIAPGGS